MESPILFYTNSDENWYTNKSFQYQANVTIIYYKFQYGTKAHIGNI